MLIVMCSIPEFKWELHKEAVNGHHLYLPFGASHCMMGIPDIHSKGLNQLVSNTCWSRTEHPTFLLMCWMIHIRINWRYYLLDDYNKLRNVRHCVLTLAHSLLYKYLWNKNNELGMKFVRSIFYSDIYWASYVQNVRRNAYKPSYKVFVIVV